MPSWSPRCEYCGRFIRINDIIVGLAVHQMVLPSSRCTDETYETYHVSCKEEHA